MNQMTVAELIKKLQSVKNQDAKVFVNDMECGYVPIINIYISKKGNRVELETNL